MARIYTMRCGSKKHYDVDIVQKLLDPSNSVLAERLADRQALIVTTPTVDRLYGASFQAWQAHHRLKIDIMVIQGGEQAKSLQQFEQICGRAIQGRLDRRSVLIGMGGGVCTDIVSVAASMFRRGIACIRIPTTLIGQVDAGIGVKGAVNFLGKKNSLGCFSPPEAVYIDPHFLTTLPQPYLRSGFAEIIKMALVRDAELFDIVAKCHASLIGTGFTSPPDEAHRVLCLSAQRMLEELEPNLYEDRTYKRLVDLGHTFSPLLEAATDFEMHHGAAVAIDTALSVTISHALGLLSVADRDRIISTVTAVGLPIYSRFLTFDLCWEALREAERHRGGAINLVLPKEIGAATFLERLADLPREVLRDAITWLAHAAAVDAHWDAGCTILECISPEMNCAI